MIRPEIVTINEVDRKNGDRIEVDVWAIRKYEDSHPAGIVVYIEGKKRSLEFTLTSAEVAELLSDAVSFMDNTVDRDPFTEEEKSGCSGNCACN